MPRSNNRLWSKSLTFQFLVLVVVEVFKVFLPDMVPDSALRSRTSTFLFPVLVPVAHGVLRSGTLIFHVLAYTLTVVFKVFLPDRVPHSVLWSRTSTFLFLVLVQVVVFSQDRVCSAQWSRSSIFQCLARDDGGGLPGVHLHQGWLRGCMPSWMRSRPTISSSLLSSWIGLPRSFRSSNGYKLKMLGVLAGMDQSGSSFRQWHVLGWYCWLLWYGSVL